MTVIGACATALLSVSVFIVVTGMHRSGTSAVAGKWHLITPSGVGPMPRFDHTVVAYKDR